jgi:very-short-patch-repair endonuclease
MHQSEYLYYVREHRRSQTIAESTLWRLLRSRLFKGFKFRRQMPVDQFIADFCCLRARLIIEVDGPYHMDQLSEDALRTAYLSDQGFKVIRFTNYQVLHQIDGVLAAIHRALTP